MPPPDAPTETPSPRLEAILRALPDAAFAGRLRRVYAAAARAIARLSDIDLVKYEPTTAEESADLSLWEEMAPVIRDTVVDVNALLAVIREEFPAPPAPALERRSREAVEVVRQAMEKMAQAITQLGEAMRSPTVVSDRWNLLTEIQSFRQRFREQIGELVFESASAFAEVARRDVVPGHEAQVQAAVTVRSIVSDLGRIVAARKQKALEAEPEDVQWNAQQLQGELDTFGRTPAYRNLRAQDKRRVIEVRARVGRLATQESPPRRELVALVEELDAWVQGLSGVNQRQVLIAHDREVWAACGVQLERALSLVERDPPAAARALAEAAMSAQALYGRQAELDAFLRKARRMSLATLGGEELRSTLDTFQGLLAGVPLH